MVEPRDDPKIIFGENYSLNYKHKITQQKLHQEISGGLLEETLAWPSGPEVFKRYVRKYLN